MHHRTTRPVRSGSGRLLLVAVPLLVAGCGDRFGPSTPSTIEPLAGDAQEAAVGEALPDEVSVRVVDGRGRGVSGATVRWVVLSGYGAASPTSSTTDGTGRASTAWTLGTVSGPQEMAARVDDTELEVRFTADAQAGAPANVQASGGDAQVGETGESLPAPLEARVVDQYGNGVPGVEVEWSVLTGGGSLAGSASTTDATGRATMSWTLGTVIGEQRVVATVGSRVRHFTAMAGAANFNMWIESVHLNQSIQNDTSGVGGVARRPGLLRVIARATEPNAVRPPVRVQLHVPGRGIIKDTLITAAPPGGVPVDPHWYDNSVSWSLRLTESEVAAGLEVVAILDPDETLPVLNRADNRFPMGTGTHPLNVQALPPFRIVFFPIVANGQVGNITESNLEWFLEPTRKWIPTSTIEATIRTPFVTDRDMTTGPAWSGLLGDLQALRTAEVDAGDRYYHGIVPAVTGSGIAGIAYVPPSSASQFRSGLTWDRSTGGASSGPQVLAHELGHNLGRFHVSGCSNPANPDVEYPHPNGGIGWPAYDIVAGTFLHAGFKDYMSYCDGVWTSDYTYAAIRTWRRDDALAAAAPATGASLAAAVAATERAPVSGLLVWGGISSRGVELNPAFALEARPSLPDAAGPYTLRGVAADGRQLFRYSFAGTAIAHAPDPDEAHFSFFVPLDDAAMTALARIEVTGPRGSAVQTRGRPAVGGPAAGAPRVEALGARGLRVRWAADESPMVLLRERDTGRIVGMGRSGDLRVESARRDRVEVLVSDGVASRRVEIQ